MGGRPSKPVASNKKHLTNAEKEQREHYEKALLSGKKITERKRVRDDAIAHGEFRRVVALMKAIGKNDALYAEQINRYAELHSEEEFYKDLAAELRGELTELSRLAKEVAVVVGQLADIRDSMDKVEAVELAARVTAVTEALSELLKRRGELLKQISDADLKVKQKREAKLAIERENCMSVSAALRTIPKDVHKDEDDELIKLLKGEFRN